MVGKSSPIASAPEAAKITILKISLPFSTLCNVALAPLTPVCVATNSSIELLKDNRAVAKVVISNGLSFSIRNLICIFSLILSYPLPLL